MIMLWAMILVAVGSVIIGGIVGSLVTLRKLPVILAGMTPVQLDELAAKTYEVKKSAS